MNIDISHIESLLEAKKFDEAKVLMREMVAAPLEDSEESSAITGFAMTYVDLVNAINIQYRDALLHAISDIKKINAAEIGTNEKFRLDGVKKSLKMK